MPFGKHTTLRMQYWKTYHRSICRHVSYHISAGQPRIRSNSCRRKSTFHCSRVRSQRSGGLKQHRSQTKNKRERRNNATRWYTFVANSEGQYILEFKSTRSVTKDVPVTVMKMGHNLKAWNISKNCPKTLCRGALKI